MSPENLLLLIAAGSGALIGVGKLLVTGTAKLPLVLGHALVTGGLSVASLAVLAVLKLDFLPTIGLCSGTALLGTVYLEKLFDRVFLTPPSSK